MGQFVSLHSPPVIESMSAVPCFIVGSFWGNEHTLLGSMHIKPEGREYRFVILP